MRLAVFCPYLPAPAESGGRIRIARLLAGVSGEHRLSLFAKASRREYAAGKSSPSLNLFTDTCVRPRGLELKAMLAESERAVTGCPTSLFRAFREAHRQNPFDGAVVEHAHAGRFALELGIPFVLDEHNVESHYLAAKQVPSRILSALQKMQVQRLAAFEESLWRNASAVISVSDDEAQVIRERTGIVPQVIPNGVALKTTPYMGAEQRAPYTLLFVGLMDHPPNVQAAHLLAQDVLPRVKASFPNARLVLCGRNPAPTVTALESADVEVTGGVPSVTEYWNQGTVFANALSDGAGTSLKVAEALASGIPMVSTAVGARGFTGLLAGKHYLPAESGTEFASQICRIFRTPAAYTTMTKSGRDVATQLDWEQLSARYLKVINSAFADT